MLKLRSFASICFFALVIPLLGVILILFQYTVHQTATRYQIQTHNMVTAIVSSVEDQIEQANTYLHEGSQSMEFLHIATLKAARGCFDMPLSWIKGSQLSFPAYPCSGAFSSTTPTQIICTRILMAMSHHPSKSRFGAFWAATPQR